ncbi:MAG: sugar kinase [Acidobacteria bacterium]|nr:sugar kinase [Acidobacteriota bacterium]
MRRFEVLTVGEGMIRLSVRGGATLETAPQFEVHIGGAESNVAVACARMGRRTAWMSRLGGDVLGARFLGEMRRHGVDVGAVVLEHGSRTGVYYAEIGDDPRGVSVTYDRANSAATRMSPGNVDLSMVAEAEVLQVSGITPAISDSSAAMTSSLLASARAEGCRIVFDVNFRARLWAAEQAREVLTPLCALADTVVCTREDARDVFGVASADDPAGALAGRLGVASVVLTDGSTGVHWHHRGSSGFAPSIPTVTVDRIGAGDAFCAGVVIGVVDGDLVAGVRLGQAMASLKRTIVGDLFLGGPADVAPLLGDAGRSVKR